MKYLGSKNRIAKYILPIILKDREPNQTYYEPFVGGGNIIDKVAGKRVGSDSNKYVISLLQEMQSPDFIPPDVDKALYEMIKKTPSDYPMWLVGYAATQLTFGSTWFGSYRRDNTGKRNYSDESKNNIRKQIPNIKGVDFVCSRYDELVLDDSSIIYCDPPYDTKATKGKYINNFDSISFWDWCRQKTKEGHKVFISEYNAPEDFVCIWKKEIPSNGNNSIKAGQGIKATEKLFTQK